MIGINPHRQSHKSRSCRVVPWREISQLMPDLSTSEQIRGIIDYVVYEVA